MVEEVGEDNVVEEGVEHELEGGPGYQGTAQELALQNRMESISLEQPMYLGLYLLSGTT